MPHVCGDEPLGFQVLGVRLGVCPTYVGMNRLPRDKSGMIFKYAPCMWG